ncbi:sugar phosphate nucleotidyltransferase [Acidiplasma sp.]|uniref:nucleotidyltransferase family protein n=2 Tax=Acidiplasma sp. TaxID=1872114 RepID=UPI00258F9A35|nr:sugar phosphate nucleotidyltransferase [Acidiplasma sp.]
MESVITAAGKGTRANLPRNMRKEMLPVYSVRDNKIVLRPVIDVIINKLSNAGIDKFFVIIDKNDNGTRDYLLSLDYKIELIYQDKPKGYGYAVSLASDYVNSNFILNAGDGFILKDDYIIKMINYFKIRKKSVISLMRVKDPSRYGIASIGGKKVLSVVEKPEKPETNYALPAFYIFEKKIFNYMKYDELTPAINDFIMAGNDVYYYLIRNSDWVSIGRSENYYKILRKTYNYSERNLKK